MKKLNLLFLTSIFFINAYGQADSLLIKPFYYKLLTDEKGFEGIFIKVKPDSIFDSVNNILSYGLIINDTATWVNNFKVGNWKEYYPNGQIKSIGSYSIGSYINCGFLGPFRSFYSFKNDLWAYWYENGEKMAEGYYKPKLKHIKTNCKGGDKIYEPTIDQTWQFWDEKGNKIKKDKEIIKNIIQNKNLIFR